MPGEDLENQVRRGKEERDKKHKREREWAKQKERRLTSPTFLQKVDVCACVFTTGVEQSSWSQHLLRSEGRQVETYVCECLCRVYVHERKKENLVVHMCTCSPLETSLLCGSKPSIISYTQLVLVCSTQTVLVSAKTYYPYKYSKNTSVRPTPWIPMLVCRGKSEKARVNVMNVVNCLSI